MSNLGKQIFHKWKTELADKDKKWNNIENNFDDLISDWVGNGLTAEETQPLIRDAVRAHMPPTKISKTVYQNSQSNKYQTYQEFVQDWSEGIESKAWQVYYLYYKVGNAASKEIEKSEMRGSMSAKEYYAQRRYADRYEEVDLSSFEEPKPIDLEELEKTMQSVYSDNNLNLGDLDE